jgi:hypothetical protein
MSAASALPSGVSGPLVAADEQLQLLESLARSPASLSESTSFFHLAKALQAVIPPVEGVGVLSDRTRWVVIAYDQCCTAGELYALWHQRLPLRIAESPHVVLVCGKPQTQKLTGSFTYIFCAKKA